jgi:excisionase family DNA binding protein
MIAMNIRDFCVATRLGRTMVQKLINEGQIRSVKIGSRRLIVDTPAEFLQRQMQEASND